MLTITSMKTWSLDDQPRFKIQDKGLDALSNSELLSILINTGTKEKTALLLAQEVLKLANNNLGEMGKLSLSDLRKIKGIGEAKATLIVAALEIGRRRQASILREKPVITSSRDIADWLQVCLKDYLYEVFVVIFLNRANKIIDNLIISKGGLTGTVADPRMIIKAAIERNATAIVLSHNHPSGNLKPSYADEELTKKIKAAAGFCDIKVLDHIIVSEEGFFSFADEGLI